MDFNNLSRLFRNTVIGLLESDYQIEEEHVKEASSILNKFARLKLNEHEIKQFLDDVLRYFVLLNHYAGQFEEINASQHCTIRMGLGVFLFVLDSTHIYEKSCKKFQRIIDVVTETIPRNFNIKEFLRIYSHLLDKVSVDVSRNLAHKQKSLPVWYKIIKSTGDIETQAIIIEVVLKLFKCNNYMNFDETFIDIVQVADVSSIDKANMYQSIRMILDTFNEFSSNIFSINCSAIKLDACRVLEFNGGVDDIWLDFNLLQNRLSFFCEQKFAPSKMKMYPTCTTWEVLSFYAKDIKNITFNYNNIAENLEIFLSISAANISLLVHANSNSVHRIEVVVSRTSDRFYQLVDHLPKIFPGLFSAEELGIPSKKEIDSSRTPDLSQAGSDDSSPVIEHFEMRKKVSARDKNSFISLSDVVEENVIVISDDENTSPVLSSKPRKRQVFNGSLNNSQHISKINNTPLSKDVTHFKENKVGVIIEKKAKKAATFKHNSTSNVFDKSVSPLSFTESVFGRLSRPQSRNSEVIANNVNKATKISTTKTKNRKEKISTVKNRPATKISSSLSSAIIKPHKELGVGKHKQQKSKDMSEEFEIEERMMDATYIDTDLDASISKVQKWLKGVDKDAPLSLDDMGYVPPKIPESEDLAVLEEDLIPSISQRGSSVPPKLPENEDLRDLSDALPPVSEKDSSVLPKLPQNEGLPSDLPDVLPSISERGSSMAPEEKIQLMMGNEENMNPDKDNRVGSVACENTVEGLLNILCSQGSKGVQDVEEPNNADRQNSHLRKNISLSEDSNVPLSELAKRCKRNSKGISKTSDGTEIANNEEVDSQSLTTNKYNQNVSVTNYTEVIEVVSKDFETTSHTENANIEHVDRDVQKSVGAITNNIEAIEVPRKSRNITSGGKSINNLESSEKITNQNLSTINHEQDEDDVTPDLEELFKKQNSSKREMNNNLDGAINHSALQPEVKARRKLYNPEDLSYLNLSLTDYLQKETNTNSPQVTQEIIHVRSRSSKTKAKGVKNPNHKTDKENITNKKKRTTKNKPNFKKTKNSAIKTNTPNLAITKSLNALKERVRQEKKRFKRERKSKHERAAKSSSSSSSMEPFGVALRNLQKEKRKQSTSANIPAKRLKEESQSVVQENKNQKIRIISDVLIQPASLRPMVEHSTSGNCCCAQLVQMTSDFYLKFVTHVSKTNPSLLSGDTQKALVQILQRSVKS